MNERATNLLTACIRSGYVFLCFFPAYYLLPFAAATLYSSPSTDDFCLASSTIGQSAAHVHQYYVSVTGRLPALALITLPSLLASGSKLDLFVVYPVFNAFVFALYLAATALVGNWLLSTREPLLGILFGLLLSCVTLSILPNISEFVYWVTGAACYLTAAIGATLFSSWITSNALSRSQIRPRSLIWAVPLCAMTAMFNEFTVFLLLGMVSLSLFFRRLVTGREAQVGLHVFMLVVILTSYAVVLLSPSNAIRLGAYSRSGDISGSIDNAIIYLADYSFGLARLDVVKSFWILVACFALVTARRLTPQHALQNILYAMALFGVAALWALGSYFIGAYSTGEVLALRARNEVVAVELVLLSACLITVVHACVGVALPFIARNKAAAAGALALAAASIGTWHIQPVTKAPTYVQLSKEWPELVTYWRESLDRNRLLSTSNASDVVVPRRTVSPRLLAGDELKESPSQLPNDCIARFYGRSSVVLARE